MDSKIISMSSILIAGKCVPYLIVSWVISVVIYQLFFHPLSSYPGPFLAKITYAYGGIHAIKGRHHLNTYKNFLKYGRVYREAPNRLMFNSLTAIQDIYINSNITKAAAYRHPGSPPKENLFSVRDNKQIARVPGHHVTGHPATRFLRKFAYINPYTQCSQFLPFNLLFIFNRIAFLY
ncbi:hypothetical protein F5B22DRAFT_588426 [Xylaria bambusicola]|uniref:uncharacterized protein n=1 Tax=Xylaria bambusicola TaxID=326684 RepID=UPI0020084E9B|nr:uncharacterized protein F5B22DRAFT_588426 [Xylaria bambusicola]KAI0525943.1 hypothetical protein F5B22DRAFT_588426 [Xylaria bambusicola]